MPNNMVKVGNVFINLESVSEVVFIGERSCRILYNSVFSDGQSYRDLFDDEALALLGYMSTYSVDVLARYVSAQKVMARMAARETVDSEMSKLYNEA